MHALLGAKEWETRIAAGDCLGLIAEHAMHPAVAQGKQGIASSAEAREIPAGAQMKLHNFDVALLLEQGEPLLAASSQARQLQLPLQNLLGLRLGLFVLPIQLANWPIPRLTLVLAATVAQCMLSRDYMETDMTCMQAYEATEDRSVPPAERLAKQRRQLRKR